MPRARVTRLLTSAPVAAPPACPYRPENFGNQTGLLLNERAAAAASTDDTRMVVVEDRPAEAEPPPWPDNFIDAAVYIGLKATLEVIFVS